MAPPIVVVAFGTSTHARDTYAFFEDRLKKRFPDNNIIWAFSSRMLRKKMNTGSNGWQGLEEILKRLEKEGYREAVIQSLHVIPGVEFQKVINAVRISPLKTAIGLPLLGSDHDYQTAADAFSEKIPDTSQWATVFVGHGTYHPAGNAYLRFDQTLKMKYPENVFVSAVEGEPVWKEVCTAIHKSSVHKVKFIPFMFVAGEHIMSDVLGETSEEGEESWKDQLEGYEIDSSERGLGFNEKIAEIYLNHLEEALSTLESYRCTNPSLMA